MAGLSAYERDVIENMRGDFHMGRKIMASDAKVVLAVVDRLTAPPSSEKVKEIVDAWNGARERYSMIHRVDKNKPTQIKDTCNGEIVHTGTQEGCFQYLDEQSAEAVARTLAVWGGKQ